MPLPPAELFSEIRRIHDHYCPMSTLGGRLGFAAWSRLKRRDGLRGVYYIATCAVDGISVATGCDPAAGSLQIEERGLHALWLSGAAGDGVCVRLRPATLTLAGGYRELDLALERDRAGLTPEELAQRSAEKEAFLDDLLLRLRQLPDEELLEFDECPPDLPALPVKS